MAADIIADNVVIGTSLAAVEYAKKNNSLILFNTAPSFFSFKKLASEELAYEKWQKTASSARGRSGREFSGIRTVAE